MKNNNIVIAVVVLLVLIGGYYIISQKKAAPTTPSPTPVTTPVTPTPNPNISTGSTPVATPVTNTAINIKNFAFNPGVVTVKAGSTVTWTNSDQAEHTVTSDTGSMLASSPLVPGATYTVTFNTPGTYNYHCTIHPSMKGTIIVN